MRSNNRKWNELRPVRITTNVSPFAEGSCQIEFGQTKVLVTASYEAQAPKWLQGSGQGWVTAEYGMLPRSTHSRMKRDKILSSGRTQEISRLIARSLRSSMDLKKFGERQITIDCDVLNADGGTRTAAITGGYVALVLALKKLYEIKEIKHNPLIYYVSAISVGMQKEQALLDMDYEEDSKISTDMNFVMTNNNHFIELQGTAEHSPFSKNNLSQMLDIAQHGCQQLFQFQKEYIQDFFPLPDPG